MSAARQTWLVASREMRERSRSRAFLISVIVMLLSVAAAIVLPALLDTGPGTKDVGLTGGTPTGLPTAVQAQGTAVDTTIRTHHFDTLAAGEAAVRDGSVDVLVVDGRRLEWRKRADEQLKAIATGAIQVVSIQSRAATAGIGPGELTALISPVPVESVELSKVAGRSADDETAAFIMTLILFGAISTYGAMVLSGVVEEKSSRTVEVLLSRIPARNLLAGKIVGIGLLGLAQIAATGAVALSAAALVGSVDMPAISGTVVIWAVVFFLIYATIFGTLGSLASRTEDASSVTGPVTIVLVLAFMVSFAVIGSAQTTWARLVSWFQLTAPTAMPNRVAMGATTWWDPVVAVVLTLATTAGLVVVGGRIYTRAILHTGATMKLSDAWHGTPSGTPVATSGRGARTPEVSSSGTHIQPTSRLDRRRVVVVAVAGAVGVAALALSGDLIISIAIAAAVYALSDRTLKAWGGSSGSKSRGESRLSVMMRAAIVDRYGPPEIVHVAEVRRPRPARREVLVRVHATAITAGDARIRGARFPAGFGPLVRLVFGVTRPRRRVLGGTFSGIVEEVGSDVADLAPGQAVCGMTGTKLGTHAEFVVARADRVARVAAGVSLDDAAGVLFGGTAALYFLRDKASVAPGAGVLINGASGAVGTNAVQLAKRFGATVTAVTSAANTELVTKLGADHVIDYANTDLAAVDARFDVVLDCVGNVTIASGRHLLADGGVLVLAVASLWDNIRAHGNVAAGSAPERTVDIEFLLDLVAKGDLTVVHDSDYDLEHIVDAHRRVDSGHKRGNVLVHPRADGGHPRSEPPTRRSTKP